MHKLGNLSIGGSNPTRIMGIINVSPESFYKKSIFSDKREISIMAKQMEEDGADFIDIGGMSTAPYLKTLVSLDKERIRITNAIEAIQKVSKLPLSIDTCRAEVAKVALELGAEILNDVSGLKYDKNMTGILEEYNPSVIVCAFSQKFVKGDQVIQTRKLLKESIAIARLAGIPKKRIIVDPAIGFFRKTSEGILVTKINSDWVKRDIRVLKNLNTIKDRFPVLVSVSRKSFIGRLLNESDPINRLYGSLAMETIAVLNGVDIIRTHDVKATNDVVQIAQNFCKSKKGL